MFLLQLTEMLFPHPGHLIQLILEQQKKLLYECLSQLKREGNVEQEENYHG